MPDNNDLENAYKSADKDGDGVPDLAEEKLDSVPDESKDQVEEDMRRNVDKGFFRKAIDKGRDTLAGETKVGKVVGFGLDVATFLAPHGSKIDTLRKKGKQALNLNKDKNDMKQVLKRALTSDGGSFIRVRDEDGNISGTAIGASVIRILLVVGIYYAAQQLGLSATDILTALQ